MRCHPTLTATLVLALLVCGGGNTEVALQRSPLPRNGLHSASPSAARRAAAATSAAEYHEVPLASWAAPLVAPPVWPSSPSLLRSAFDSEQRRIQRVVPRDVAMNPLFQFGSRLQATGRDLAEVGPFGRVLRAERLRDGGATDKRHLYFGRGLAFVRGGRPPRAVSTVVRALPASGDASHADGFPDLAHEASQRTAITAEGDDYWPLLDADATRDLRGGGGRVNSVDGHYDGEDDEEAAREDGNGAHRARGGGGGGDGDVAAAPVAAAVALRREVPRWPSEVVMADLRRRRAVTITTTRMIISTVDPSMPTASVASTTTSMPSASAASPTNSMPTTSAASHTTSIPTASAASPTTTVTTTATTTVTMSTTATSTAQLSGNVTKVNGAMSFSVSDPVAVVSSLRIRSEFVRSAIAAAVGGVDKNSVAIEQVYHGEHMEKAAAGRPVEVVLVYEFYVPGDRAPKIEAGEAKAALERNFLPHLSELLADASLGEFFGVSATVPTLTTLHATPLPVAVSGSFSRCKSEGLPCFLRGGQP